MVVVLLHLSRREHDRHELEQGDAGPQNSGVEARADVHALRFAGDHGRALFVLPEFAGRQASAFNVYDAPSFSPLMG
jgi:hypothetical protein